jgi:hypothetical protein
MTETNCLKINDISSQKQTNKFITARNEGWISVEIISGASQATDYLR